VKVVRADVHQPGVLAAVLNGANVAINLVGILNEAGRDGAGFRHAHVDLTRTLIEACNDRGVSRLIQVSALNAANPATTSTATSHYLRSKGEAEALLRASPLRWTILQPSVIFGPGDSFLIRFAGLLRALPLVFPLAMPQARFSPVHVDDVVEAIARALREPSTVGSVYQLYGPDTYTLRELVQMVSDQLGLRRQIIGLPRTISRLQAAIMDFVPGKPFSTDNFRSLLTDSVGTADGLRELGITPRRLRPNLAATLAAAGLSGVRDN